MDRVPSATKKHWHVVHAAELGATAQEVWDLIGGFFTIHLWHPDIATTVVPDDQNSISPIRRLMTFPGQPSAIDELVILDNPGYYCRYKWFKGPWGERVQQYVSDLRVFESAMGKQCYVQWSAYFLCEEDAVSGFYLRGLDSLKKRFPL